MEYPECEKLKAVDKQIVAIRNFFDFLQENHIGLMDFETAYPAHVYEYQREELILKYFGIDQKELEKERKALLESCR